MRAQETMNCGMEGSARWAHFEGSVMVGWSRLGLFNDVVGVGVDMGGYCRGKSYGRMKNDFEYGKRFQWRA